MIIIKYFSAIIIYIWSKSIFYFLLTQSFPVFPPIVPIILFFYIRKEVGPRFNLLRVLPFLIGIIPALPLIPIQLLMLSLSKSTNFRMDTILTGAVYPIGLWVLIVYSLEAWIILTMRSIAREHLSNNKKIKNFMRASYIYCALSLLGYTAKAFETFGLYGLYVWYILLMIPSIILKALFDIFV